MESAEISDEPNWERACKINNDCSPAVSFAQVEKLSEKELELRRSTAQLVDPGELGIDALLRWQGSAQLSGTEGKTAIGEACAADMRTRAMLREFRLCDGSDEAVRALMFSALSVANTAIVLYEILRRELGEE